MTRDAQAKIQALIGKSFESLAIFLSSLQASGAAANKRVKPVLQFARELASLPCSKDNVATLRSLGKASAGNEKKKGKGKKDAATPGAGSVDFDAAAAKLVSAVQIESQKSTEGNSGSLAGQCLQALKGMGLEIKAVTPTTATSTTTTGAEGSKGKKRKKLSQLEEEELRIVSKQQGAEDEGENADQARASKKGGGEKVGGKWFGEEEKQQRRPKKKKTA